MSAPTFGNVLTRLQGLKNVSGKKIKQIPGFQDNLMPADQEVEGTAQAMPDFRNFVPETGNVPQSDTGVPLTTQSYDVRANQVETPEKEGGFFDSLRRFGESLGNALKSDDTAYKKHRERLAELKAMKEAAPPVATQQVEASEGMPPVSNQQEMLAAGMKEPDGRGFWGAIQDYFSPEKQEDVNKNFQYAQAKYRGEDTDAIKQQQSDAFMQQIENASQNPGKDAVIGSAEYVQNNPALQADFKEITGIDYTPEIADQVKTTEAAMQGVIDTLNGENKRLDEISEAKKQRMLQGQSTDEDKYLIGMALLLPALIGAFFGKEAGLNALAGGFQGYGNILNRRSGTAQEEEKALLDLSKQKSVNAQKLGEIEQFKAALGPELRKAIPESQEKHLMGMQEANWTDPVTGKDVKGVEILPDLIAKKQFVNTPDGKAATLKNANDLARVKDFTFEVMDLTDDIMELASKLDEKNRGWLSEGFSAISAGQVPSLSSRVTPDVEFKGQKVNSGAMLNELLGFLANAYSQAKELGALDRAAQNHIEKLMQNPATSFATPETTIQQMMRVRDLVSNGLVRSAESRGFYGDFLKPELMRRNEELMSRFTKKEDKALKNKITQNLMRE